MRKLTPEEIENILDFIQPNKLIPEDCAKSLYKIHKTRLKNQLKVQKIYPEMIPELKETLKRSFYDSLISPAECVGIISGQSIGQRNTQSTLNTFHFTGQAESQVLTGVPRFQELLNATKEPKGPGCKIHIQDNPSTLEEAKDVIGSNLVQLTIGDISKEIKVLLDHEEEVWFESFRILYEDEVWYKDCSEYNNGVKIILDMDKLFRYKLKLEDIAVKIHDKFADSYCIFSPENICEFIIYFDCSEIKLDTEKLLYITKDNCIQIYLEETVEPNLMKTVIAGVEGISNMYFYKSDGKWLVDTDGSNFRTVLLLPFTDRVNTISNNIWEIYEILGIEATKQYLMEEFANIVEVSKCHISVLVSRMTFGGTISSISRYTMRKEKIGTISKSSFEETVDQFVRAAANGETDDIKSVSSAIVCGNRAGFGTGMMDIKVDLGSILANCK